MTGPTMADSPRGAELIAALLDRPLTAEEFVELQRLAAADRSVRDALQVAQTLQHERAALQATRGAEASWERFQATLAGADARHADNAGPGLVGRLRTLVVGAPAALASLLVLETAALGWLLLAPVATLAPAYRSAGNACPPYLVRFKPEATERELRRVLLQAGAAIAAGPDDQALYRLTAPGVELARLRDLLAPVADSVDDNAACAAPRGPR